MRLTLEQKQIKESCLALNSFIKKLSDGTKYQDEVEKHKLLVKKSIKEYEFHNLIASDYFKWVIGITEDCVYYSKGVLPKPEILMPNKEKWFRNLSAKEISEIIKALAKVKNFE